MTLDVAVVAMALHGEAEAQLKHWYGLSTSQKNIVRKIQLRQVLHMS